MKSQLAAVLGGCVISFGAMAYFVRKAPAGYQDDCGFHHGDRHPEEERLAFEAAGVKSPEQTSITLEATDQLAG